MKKINTFFKAVFSALAIIFCLISFASDAPTPGGTWKIVFSSADGPQGRALEVLTER